MTRKEAIQYIDGLHCEEDFPYTDTIADFVKERNEAIDMAIEALKADTVEVVRCKDCRFAEHREQAERVYCHIERLAISCPPRDYDDFCKYGERSEE